MKANELLKLYQLGERNFRRENLKGQSFKGKNLEGADFSDADIRGTDFTNARLKAANFNYAKAGLQPHWVIGLLIVVCLLSALLGFITTFTGLYTTSILIPKINNIFALAPLLAIIVTLSGLFIIFIRKRLRDDRNILQSFHGAISVTFSAYGTVAAVISFIVILLANFIELVFGSTYHFLEIFLAAILVSAFVSAYSVGLTLAVAGAVCISNFIAGIFVLASAVFGGIIATNKFQFIDESGFVYIAIIINIITSIMGGNAGWKALNRDEKWLASGSLIIGLAAVFGTSFRGADLTDANFEKTVLKNTNFINYSEENKTTLTRTCFYQAQKLDLARVGRNYLDIPKVRQWVITGSGEDKNFDSLNLRGINLAKFNLADASFRGTDLSEANLQDVDLSRSQLVQTQLDETDLTGATLTGATIEDWGITNQTKLDGVRCEYVFMRVPTRQDPNPHRKPDNWAESFADGDFADFIKPIFDTLDFYHIQGVDPRAVAISFKQLAENHPEAELRIAGMERKGEGNFLLRVQAAQNANFSELSAEYFSIYEECKALTGKQVAALFSKMDGRMRNIENMVETLLERPNNIHLEIHTQGNITMTDNRKINTGGGNYHENNRNINTGGGDYHENTTAGQNQSSAQSIYEKSILAFIKVIQSQSGLLSTTDRADLQQMIINLPEEPKEIFDEIEKWLTSESRSQIRQAYEEVEAEMPSLIQPGKHLGPGGTKSPGGAKSQTSENNSKTNKNYQSCRELLINAIQRNSP